MVLAGGSSTRFGSDKLAARYRGLPLLQHPVRCVAEVCGDVVVVLAPGAPEPTFLAGMRARVARDTEEGAGPLAGLAAGLAAVNTELALVVGGDMPGLVPSVLRKMLRIADASDVDAVVLESGEGPSPLPCVVRVGVARDDAETMLRGEERSLGGLLDRLRSSSVGEDVWTALDPERSTLRDVDTPGDLDPR